MDELFNYYRNSVLDGLDEDMKERWRKAKGDKEALVKLALSQRAIPHVARYMYEKRGVTWEYVLREFNDYVNGYVVHDADGVKGYTYAWYVDWDYAQDLVVDVNVAHITHTIGASVVVPKTRATTIYMSNHSNIHLVLEGFNNVVLHVFDKTKVTIEDSDDESAIIVLRHGDDAAMEKGKYCFCNKIKESVVYE